MCGAPEHLSAFGARAHFPSFITTTMDHKVQLVKPLNTRGLTPRSRNYME
jgi:hypothetical protein